MFDSEEAEAEFWAENKPDIRLMESSMASATESSDSVTITLRMDPRMLARIKRLARSRYLNYQSMIKQWLSERMEQELRGAPRMNSSYNTNLRSNQGFTLIELLVVIAVIALMAAMIFPVTGAVTRARISKKVTAELTQLESAIENYKSKLGYFPPDNPGLPFTNQLYYELLGARVSSANPSIYEALDGSSTVNFAQPTFFGSRVKGIMNSTRPGADDDAARAQTFLTNLKPTQNAQLTTGERVLVCSVPWPTDSPFQPIPVPPAQAAGVNPWRYNSSSPTNNPNGFDLWVDVIIAGKTNRFSNWSAKPQIVASPW